MFDMSDVLAAINSEVLQAPIQHDATEYYEFFTFETDEGVDYYANSLIVAIMARDAQEASAYKNHLAWIEEMRQRREQQEREASEFFDEDSRFTENGDFDWM